MTTGRHCAACVLVATACGGRGASERALLAPVTASPPAAAWRQQWLAAPSYHGRFTIVARGAGTSGGAEITGKIASEPATRRLHVTTHEIFRSGTDHYVRQVELVIDGRRARLTGENADGDHHTTVATLPPVRDPAAPFGEVPDAQAGFTFGGDLRQTVLDCLTDATLSPAGPGEWAVTRAADRVFAELTARGDPSLVDLHGGPGAPRDRCAGLVLLARPDGALRGTRQTFPDGAVTEMTFTVFAGADASEFTIPEASLVEASSLDDALAARRAQVDALLADPAARARARAALDRR